MQIVHDIRYSGLSTLLYNTSVNHHGAVLITPCSVCANQSHYNLGLVRLCMAGTLFQVSLDLIRKSKINWEIDGQSIVGCFLRH